MARRRMAVPPPVSAAGNRTANVVAKRAKPGRQPARGVKTVTQTYTVTGNRAVAGNDPGETVELTLNEAVAQSLIEAGHLAIAETPSEGR